MSQTVIEHAIAIPTKQHHVWSYIQDIRAYPQWQVDCESISFLNNQITGRGTRWRSIFTNGKAQVIEVTAWYEGLGFEYTIVDGVEFTTNRGRIRLQEVPEGTIVQWTFSYELTGFLSGIKNTLLVRRKTDHAITDSLRNLYTLVKQKRGDEQFKAHQASSFSRSAPDVEERAKYQPRYPSALNQGIQSAGLVEEAPSPELESISSGLIPEPALTDEDTQPNEAIPAPSEQAPLPEQLSEPSFLKDVPLATSSSQPEEIQSTQIPEPKTTPVQPLETSPVPMSEPQISTPETIIQSEASPPTEQPITPKEEPIPSKPEVSKQEQEAEKPVGATSLPALPGLPDNEMMDTSKISVFEIFGLQKPSETEPITAITDEDLAAATPSSSEIAAFMEGAPTKADLEPEIPKRFGLRASLRRRKSKVRQPK